MAKAVESHASALPSLQVRALERRAEEGIAVTNKRRTLVPDAPWSGRHPKRRGCTEQPIRDPRFRYQYRDRKTDQPSWPPIELLIKDRCDAVRRVWFLNSLIEHSTLRSEDLKDPRDSDFCHRQEVRKKREREVPRSLRFDRWQFPYHERNELCRGTTPEAVFRQSFKFVYIDAHHHIVHRERMTLSKHDALYGATLLVPWTKEKEDRTAKIRVLSSGHLNVPAEDINTFAEVMRESEISPYEEPALEDTVQAPPMVESSDDLPKVSPMCVEVLKLLATTGMDPREAAEHLGLNLQYLYRLIRPVRKLLKSPVRKNVQ
jgi:hypothetical protein